MLGEQQWTSVVAQALSKRPLGVELLLHPERAGLKERTEAPWRDGEVSVENALEFEQGLIIEADEGKFGCLDPAGCQAVLDCPHRKSSLPLSPSEALLLGCRHDLSIAEQACGAVVVEGGDSEKARWWHGLRPLQGE